MPQSCRNILLRNVVLAICKNSKNCITINGECVTLLTYIEYMILLSINLF